MHSPQTIDELRRLIETANSSLHALGTRHSFNDIADAAGLISLEALPGEMTIDEDARSVSVPAAMRYGNLARQLHEAGWALSNLPSLPHITVASSVATATHGSGNANQSLASAVTAMNLITGSGDRLPDAAAVEALVERIEQVLQPFQPRPHWSKVFGAGHDWSGLYPAFADFRRLAEAYDPRGVFRTPFLARTVLEPATP